MKYPLSKQIGLEILKKARLLYKAWEQENREAILDCTQDISRSMMDSLRVFGLEEDRLFAVLKKQEEFLNIQNILYCRNMEKINEENNARIGG